MNRDELYQKFGPLLIEALVLIIKDEINLLRAEHGLPERTDQQLMYVISSKLDELTLYDWMKDSV